MTSKIEWTNETWNPTVGCSKVSPGCDNCYAERMARRQVAIAKAKGLKTCKYYGTVDEFGRWTGKIGIDIEGMFAPLHWKKPRMIFVPSMGDMFHENVKPYYIDSVLNIIKECPQHIFQILTKRPGRVIKNITNFRGHDYKLPENIWFGVTAENQEQEWRILKLLKIPAAVRFVSLEPILESIGIPWITKLDWVIVGAESGPHRRECKIRWVRDIVEQCEMAGVPVFVKQLSIDGKISHVMNQWPEDLWVRQWPNMKGAK